MSSATTFRSTVLHCDESSGKDRSQAAIAQRAQINERALAIATSGNERRCAPSFMAISAAARAIAPCSKEPYPANGAHQYNTRAAFRL
jgi:hypothetical protein